MNTIDVISPAFSDNGAMPVENTGFGADRSPEFRLSGLCENAVSIAITMDDLDIPFVKVFNHWVIWNIPAAAVIPGGIPCGPVVKELGGAIQGVGWGKNMYRGPKQPPFIHSAHRYKFSFYVLDSFLSLTPGDGKRGLLKAMQGHVWQTGGITGVYKPSR